MSELYHPKISFLFQSARFHVTSSGGANKKESQGAKPPKNSTNNAITHPSNIGHQPFNKTHAINSLSLKIIDHRKPSNKEQRSVDQTSGPASHKPRNAEKAQKKLELLTHKVENCNDGTPVRTLSKPFTIKHSCEDDSLTLNSTTVNESTRSLHDKTKRIDFYDGNDELLEDYLMSEMNSDLFASEKLTPCGPTTASNPFPGSALRPKQRFSDDSYFERECLSSVSTARSTMASLSRMSTRCSSQEAEPNPACITSFLRFVEMQKEFDRNLKNVTIEDMMKELREFNPCNKIEDDVIQLLLESEVDFEIDQFYLETTQPEITWLMRAILFEWMMEVSNEFGFKRETYHLAIKNLDRYLSARPCIKRADLQLAGLTCLFIAAKTEEITMPNIQSFAKTADDGYSVEQIGRMEIDVCKALRWRMNPPTHFMWANYYMGRWDEYLRMRNDDKSVFVNAKAYFKQESIEAYANFRNLMQILDCALFDVQTLQYRPRAVVITIMYLYIDKFLQSPSEDAALLSTNNKSKSLCDTFTDFVRELPNTEISDIIQCMEYLTPFLDLEFTYDLPLCIQTARAPTNRQVNFEDFVTYQTFHKGVLDFVKKRHTK